LDDDRMRRMEALRARVKAKKQQGALPVEPSELVVTPQDVVDADDSLGVSDDAAWLEMLDRDADRWRNLAAALILIGSILGAISGLLILQGNPSELLNTSLFAEREAVDISGSALEDVEGHGVELVTVELLEGETRALLQTTTTDRFGHFTLKNLSQETHIIVFSKEGYETVERTFIPDGVGLDPVTMKQGEGIRYEQDEDADSGWTLDNAVGLSTAIGLVTLIAAGMGVQASIESRRGRHYRRSQYLAGFALFSRGLIVIGPAFILFGMILNVFAREDFEDQRED